ncbi:unnamed protein product [Adineta steineri]|uniref:Uncharacterized protein n=1 Tax=Adineta steineri TaxID=433720 RepID=A0A814NUE3_9BILA|nr:unnamed protein product [Adineta steineri]CAF1098702.1 unnamed protein product [Adineta steineri]CAF1142096.1 unnamed protein product [Adineta steineri]CAF3696381.1 unnamed protein product [Adineta steineri]CAF3863883.1 unnamed protein product [Adineta steineri]
MWNSQLVLSIFIFKYLLSIGIYSQEIFIIDENNNSTNEEYIISTKDPLPTWTNQQLIVCFISVSLGTLLFFVTFIVPAMIIIRRARRDKNRFDLRELRRMSDFM